MYEMKPASFQPSSDNTEEELLRHEGAWWMMVEEAPSPMIQRNASTGKGFTGQENLGKSASTHSKGGEKWGKSPGKPPVVSRMPRRDAKFMSVC